MKKVEAIIRSSTFEKVRESLSQIGVNFMTFMEVKGFGKQKGEEVYYRGAIYDIGYIARMEVQIIVEDEKVDEVVATILDAAYTGEVGDGKVIVSSIDKVISIRTKSEGDGAI